MLVGRIAQAFTVILCGEMELFLLILYAASWASYYATGHFLGTAALNLWSAAPLLLIRHVVDLEPAILAVVPLFAVLTSVLLTLSVSWALFKLPERACRAITLLALVSLAISVLVAVDTTSKAEKFLAQSGIPRRERAGSPCLGPLLG
jgi:hypothetical protein